MGLVIPTASPRALARVAKATRLLGLQRDWIDPTVVAAGNDVPTVTMPVAVGYTSTSPGTAPIASGVWRSLRRVASGIGSMDTGIAVDTTNDLLVELIGNPDVRYGTSFPDQLVARPQYLTGGTSQAARWSPIVRFVHTGTVVAVRTKANATSMVYRARVNGRYVTTAMQTVSGLSAGSLYDLVLTFPGAGTRDIELEFADSGIVGVCMAPTDSLHRPTTPRFTLAGFGDSITGGAVGVQRQDTWLRYASDYLGARYVNLAIGGSGYIAGDGTNAFSQRLADITRANPDALVVFGGYNDVASNSASVAASSLSFMTSVVNALPNTLVIMAGLHRVGSASDAASLTVANALRTTAATLGIPFVDPWSPAGDPASITAWSSGTQYGAGDVVSYNNLVYQANQRMASGQANPSANAQWHQLGWVTGTGKAGSTTGDGNADVMISSDGTHPTALGHQILGARMAAEIGRAARSIVAAGF